MQSDDDDPIENNFRREVVARLVRETKVPPDVARSCARLFFTMRNQLSDETVVNDAQSVVNALKASGLLNAVRLKSPTTVSSANASAKWSSKTDTSSFSEKNSPRTPRSLVQFGSYDSDTQSQSPSPPQFVNCKQVDYTTCEGVFDALRADLFGAQEIAACRAIGSLCRNNPNAAHNRVRLGRLGTCATVCATARKFVTNVDVLVQVCFAIHSLCVSNSDNGGRLAAAGACSVVVGAVRSFPGNAEVVLHACWSIANLASGADEICLQLSNAGAIDTLISSARAYSRNTGIIKQVCMAISNLTFARPQLRNKLVEKVTHSTTWRHHLPTTSSSHHHLPITIPLSFCISALFVLTTHPMYSRTLSPHHCRVRVRFSSHRSKTSPRTRK